MKRVGLRKMIRSQRAPINDILPNKGPSKEPSLPCTPHHLQEHARRTPVIQKVGPHKILTPGALRTQKLRNNFLLLLCAHFMILMKLLKQSQQMTQR